MPSKAAKSLPSRERAAGLDWRRAGEIASRRIVFRAIVPIFSLSRFLSETLDFFISSLFCRKDTLNHMIHHRGQLSVYLRLLGIALPPVYGPTADESTI